MEVVGTVPVLLTDRDVVLTPHPIEPAPVATVQVAGEKVPRSLAIDRLGMSQRQQVVMLPHPARLENPFPGSGDRGSYAIFLGPLFFDPDRAAAREKRAVYAIDAALPVLTTRRNRRNVYRSVRVLP